MPPAGAGVEVVAMSDLAEAVERFRAAYRQARYWEPVRGDLAARLRLMARHQIRRARWLKSTGQS